MVSLGVELPLSTRARYRLALAFLAIAVIFTCVSAEINHLLAVR